MRINGVTYGKLKTPLKVNDNLKLKALESIVLACALLLIVVLTNQAKKGAAIIIFIIITVIVINIVEL